MPAARLSRKTIATLIVISVVLLCIALLILTKPEAKKQRPPGGPSISVKTLKIEPQLFEPIIVSYGLVEPRTKSKLVAQVTGRIELVAEHFRDGGFFKQGDILLEIDATDYEIEVEIAKANLAEAERGYEEEQAQSQQAKEDWLRLGEDSEPSALVLRLPQLKAAKANMLSAKAQLDKARVNLKRTKIIAPFDGRVLSTSVDLGQVAANNEVLGEIYATDTIEVRLPIKNNEIPLLTLPETYSHQKIDHPQYPSVAIHSDLAGEEVWQGEIVRTASSIDSTSRQLYVVARIDDPFGEKAEGRFPLKIGQYVTAKIEGKTQQNTIIIPNNAIYQGTYIYTYKEGAVYRKDINIQWQNGTIALIGKGLEMGDEIVVSPLGQVASGTLVNKINADGSGEKSRPKEGRPPMGAGAMPIDQWLKSLAPERLNKMKERAQAEGISLEELAQQMRKKKDRSQ